MVDPVGPKPVRTNDRVVVAITRPASAPGTAQGGQAARTGIAALAREQAVAAPVDAERVERIRAAIRDGNFPINPAKIADRLIAAQLEWNSHDPA